ncbi:hypothetical protein [Dickeya dadantii]|uniref:hypothetical protein n=1 Tax=Dickeya dadantii TaxID=204038 RepID=UPI000577D203|nr:hypothetical protein [Dickeya dadantii]
MDIETEKNTAITNFIDEFGYKGDHAKINVEVKKKNRIFMNSKYEIKVFISKSTTIVEDKNENDKKFERSMIIYLVICIILGSLFLLGAYNEYKFYELGYFTPIFFGFLYFRVFYPFLGELLKKQADAVSFFLGMLTSCGLIFKLSEVPVKSIILKEIPDYIKIFCLYFTLYFLCIFISVKFFISLLDYLKSLTNTNTNTNTKYKIAKFLIRILD